MKHCYKLHHNYIIEKLCACKWKTYSKIRTLHATLRVHYVTCLFVCVLHYIYMNVVYIKDISNVQHYVVSYQIT